MEIRALIFDYYGVLAKSAPGGWQLDMQLINLIQNLKRDYKVGLLSNTYAKSVAELNSALDPTLFDIISLGGATGLWKPDERAFTTIAQQLKLHPNQVMIIDDSQKHLAVANQLGFATLLYQNIDDLRKKLI